MIRHLPIGTIKKYVRRKNCLTWKLKGQPDCKCCKSKIFAINFQMFLIVDWTYIEINKKCSMKHCLSTKLKGQSNKFRKFKIRRFNSAVMSPNYAKIRNFTFFRDKNWISYFTLNIFHTKNLLNLVHVVIFFREFIMKIFTRR